MSLSLDKLRPPSAGDVFGGPYGGVGRGKGEGYTGVAWHGMNIYLCQVASSHVKECDNTVKVPRVTLHAYLDMVRVHD